LTLLPKAFGRGCSRRYRLPELEGQLAPEGVLVLEVVKLAFLAI
jgi:hypothetical protein